MNAMSLRSEHRHVSAIHVAIFRVVTTRIQIKCVEIIPQLFRHICVFLLLPSWR